ncbi:metal ABC transporter substrate-binding protein [Cellulomonas cellasea]|uniref:metal ABC transporter substrate-binding protein n=1 Tax=Cellulomonas cellasea TaxID=43670 RepID=UPI0025A479FF|nr:metal ABC transporter substrate-binding protein [Cellulomonas cellasea]MDM8084146.1 metal ABC transporter substrate-binding protein [Cellulomonas cellasea]
MQFGRGLLGPTCGLSLAALILTGCGAAADGASDTRLSVSASFYPLQFVTQAVGGDRVDVSSLTPPGAEPHDLELSPSQVNALRSADLVVYLSGFQPAVDEAVATADPAHIVNAADVTTLLPFSDEPVEEAGEEDHAGHDHADHDHDGHDHGDLDPHFWLDPTLLAPVADAVAAQLSELDPDGAEEFQANAQALTARLDELDAAYQQGLASCERRVFVTTHTAFGYLAERYGLEEVGISGIDPEAEPSPARLQEIRDVVESEGVTTIFFEALVSPKVAQTLAADLGIESAVLDPLEGVSGSQTYFSVAEDNLQALQTALACA